jgi:C1A family cysteine protease
MIVSRSSAPGLGWLRDLPDPRDFTPDHEEVRRLLAPLKQRKSPRPGLPQSVDLRFNGDSQQFFSRVDDQGALNCSAACALLGLVEYLERRAHGHTFEGSILFLYKMARKLRRMSGDCGVDLRTTLRALVRFGVPPAELWCNEPDKFDEEPPELGPLGFARDYTDVCYVRLDARNAPGEHTLLSVKSYLAAQFPVAFGFPVPRSLGNEPDIPYRPTFDSIRGGQAVLAVGYDDRHVGAGPGALLIRNSWGATWGDAGYGWLPYDYVKQQLCADFWTILRPDWLASGEFLRPSGAPS